MDFSFSPLLLALEWIGFGTIECGFAGARDDNATQTTRVADGEHVGVGTESDGGEWSLWDWVGEV